jgi:hypothetical protein
VGGWLVSGSVLLEVKENIKNIPSKSESIKESINVGETHLLALPEPDMSLPAQPLLRTKYISHILPTPKVILKQRKIADMI